MLTAAIIAFSESFLLGSDSSSRVYRVKGYFGPNEYAMNFRTLS